MRAAGAWTGSDHVLPSSRENEISEFSFFVFEREMRQSSSPSLPVASYDFDLAHIRTQFYISVGGEIFSGSLHCTRPSGVKLRMVL